MRLVLVLLFWLLPTWVGAAEPVVSLRFSWTQAQVGDGVIVGDYTKNYLAPRDHYRPFNFQTLRIPASMLWPINERRQFVTSLVQMVLQVKIDEETFDFFALFAGERLGPSGILPVRITARQNFVGLSYRIAVHGP